MGGKKGNKSKKSKKKSYTKAQKLARKRLGLSTPGESTSTAGNNSGVSGIGPVASGDSYAKSLSTATNQPTKKTSGIGPYADGKKYAEALKKSPPRFSSGTMDQQKAALRRFNDTGLIASHDKPLFKSVPARLDQPASPKYIEGMLQQNIKPSTINDLYGIGTKTAMLPGDNMGSILGTGAALGFGLSLPGMIKNAKDAGEQLQQNIQRRLNPEENQNQSSLGISNALASAGDLTGVGIGSTPNYFSVKSPDSYGAPSQEAVDKAAGITAGGLNIGGAGFTPKDFNDPTARVADAYKSTLNPDSFKGLSDGETFGSGPVASGEDYARGLNVDHNNVENIMRRFVEKRLPFIDALPGVNTRRLTDKEIADKRVKAQKMRKEMMLGRSGSGGNRLPVTPTVIEEILPEALPVPSASTTPTTQTGVDPNRLLQIQQQAYAQAYNPMLIGGFNPQFRFGAATPTIDYSTYFNY